MLKKLKDASITLLIMTVVIIVIGVVLMILPILGIILSVVVAALVIMTIGWIVYTGIRDDFGNFPGD